MLKSEDYDDILQDILNELVDNGQVTIQLGTLRSKATIDAFETLLDLHRRRRKILDRK